MVNIRTAESFVPNLGLPSWIDKENMNDFASALKQWQDIRNNWDMQEVRELQKQRVLQEQQKIADSRAKTALLTQRLSDYVSGIDPNNITPQNYADLMNISAINNSTGEVLRGLNAINNLNNRNERNAQKSARGGASKATQDDVGMQYLQETNGNLPQAYANAVSRGDIKGMKWLYNYGTNVKAFNEKVLGEDSKKDKNGASGGDGILGELDAKPTPQTLVPNNLDQTSSASMGNSYYNPAQVKSLMQNHMGETLNDLGTGLRIRVTENGIELVGRINE